METEVVTDIRKDSAILSTIYTRRAVRKYKAKSVDKKLIEQLLAAGRMAPSAMNRQPWKFYVVTNKEIIHKLSGDIAKKAFKETVRKGMKGVLKTLSALFHFVGSFDLSTFHDPVFYGAPVVIFITAPNNNEWAQLDIGMCAQNIMLTAKSIGLDTCPIGFGKFVEHTKHSYLLNIPETESVQLSIIVGYGEEKPPAHERKTDNVVYIE